MSISVSKFGEKTQVAYFRLQKKGWSDKYHRDFIILEIGETVPKDALMIICEKTQFSQEDNPIRTITLVRTQGDYTQIDKIQEVWLALFDFENLKIVQISDVKVLGEIKASQKTV